MDTLPQDAEFDLVILGAGAAGLAAAVFAGLRGARTLVVERSGSVGGTSATTAGTLWLPGRHPTDGRSPASDAALAAEYLDAVIGPDDASAALRARFLEDGASVIDELERCTRVVFNRRDHHPDYLGDRDGASTAGRAIEAADFDGRLLGPDLRHVRPPLRDFTIFGGLAPSREEVKRYSVIATRPFTLRAWRHAFGAIPRVARHIADRAVRGRSSWLTLGNALIGRLLASLQDLGTARIVLHSTVTSITRGTHGIDSVTLLDARTGTTKQIRPRAGLVSATGGFSRGVRRAELLPGLPAEWSAVADSVEGGAHALLEHAGAVFARQGTDAFWAPVSLVPAADGTTRVYPHFALDRGKPGFVLVDQGGRRFVSEAAPYHVVGEAMLERPQRVPSYLIADRAALRRYGLGVVRPGGWGLHARLRDGYVTAARTLDDLGARIGLPEGALAATVARFNRDAARGVDEAFGRGNDPYQRALGDAGHRPNPSLGALGPGPYYSIRLHPGDIGSASGFVTDERARALDADGAPIPGLYVLGSDMRSIMGGRYPGPGITLGPAIVFAALAVRDAIERAR
ncbi:hypothetical protein BAY59_27225 [Prauserella coralliicola]|nr:hypothetical protein BAY59_27225 [Prauserella coralliicola]